MSTTRYHTRVAVVAHSHVSKPDSPRGYIDLSGDVIELSTSKQIKGIGTFSFTLVPRRNYLNMLYPDDVVNIYIDPGDGVTGLTRTMMGYIDRIERTEVVDKNTGAMTTMFKVTGSDFAKAIDKTNIYFNPDLGLRPDVSATFGNTNLGGNALRTKGVRIHGTPADIVEDLLELLFGFGAQWVLPESYPAKYVLANRKQRTQRAVKRFPDELKAQLKANGYTDVTNVDFADEISNFLASKNATFSDINYRTKSFDVLSESDVKKLAIADILANNTAFLAYQSALRKSGQQTPATLLDLMDTSFIESLAMDGYIQAESIWQSKGSLLSILHANANEIINELCFDLRPVATGGPDSMAGNKYDTSPDELEINEKGTEKIPKNGPTGIRYVPAVIMREYPHSVAEGLDLSGHIILGTDKVGFIPMGPIFAQGAGEGLNRRYLFDYSDSSDGKTPFVSLTAVPCDFKTDSKPIKHIDVVAIHNSDVTMDAVGRSDADTYNLITLYSSNPLLKGFELLLVEFVPTLTQVSIERHGLRVLDAQTKFASTTADPLCHMNGTSIDNAAIRKNIIRWALLLDHWNQHNIEYLTGIIQLRGMPEIRVGYRLDWMGRNESYYVESVEHSWHYPDAMTTTVQVSRGQRNDPFPLYIPPAIAAIDKAKVTTVPAPQGDNSFNDGELNEEGTGTASGSFTVVRPVVPLSFLNTGKNSSSAFSTVNLVRDGGTRPHLGNDYLLSVGQDVFSIADGIVARVGYQNAAQSITRTTDAISQNPVNKYGANAGRGGLFVEITHTVGSVVFKSRYMHLDHFIVAEGDHVTAGQKIGTGGDSGNPRPKSPHLHFEIKQNGAKVDPAFFLGSFLGLPQKTPTAIPNQTTATVKPKIDPKTAQVGGGDRSSKGRLATFFNVKDTQATMRAVHGKPNGDTENTVDKKTYPMDQEKAWPAKANKTSLIDDAALEAINGKDGALKA